MGDLARLVRAGAGSAARWRGTAHGSGAHRLPTAWILGRAPTRTDTAHLRPYGDARRRTTRATPSRGTKTTRILSVENPEAPSPPNAGLAEERRADFPKRLQGLFEERRFIPVDPPDFLDHPGAELMLVGADEDVSGELGLDLDPAARLLTRLGLVPPSSTPHA